MLILQVKDKDDSIIVESESGDLLEIVIYDIERHRVRLGFNGHKFKVFRKTVFDNVELKKIKETKMVKRFAKTIT